MPTARKSEDSYTTILERELEGRCRNNPRYSLRAFARDLGISPSRLSEVLRGRYGMSRKAAEAISDRLGFSAQERERFCDLVESRHARNRTQRKLAETRLLKYVDDGKTRSLNLDTFAIVSDWHHFAILELVHLEGFRNDAKWIGRALGIPSAIVPPAIERLKRAGLLEQVGGELRVLLASSFTTDGTPSEAIRAFHSQLLDKARQALFTQPLERREYASIVLSVPRKRLPEAKERIRAFHRDFNDSFSKAGQKRDAVYCLGLQFFEMTRNSVEGESA
jgi:uncharacterized protein (TIGR02147 family)